MTDFTIWAAQRSAVQWLSSKRLIRWLWRWRWPGFPITVVLVLTVVFTYHDVTDGKLLDKIILSDIVIFLLLLLVAIVVGTPRNEWSERTTGLFLFAVAELTLYGYFILLPTMGVVPPYTVFAKCFLRANLVVGPFLLVLSYSDWIWLRIKLRRLKHRK